MAKIANPPIKGPMKDDPMVIAPLKNPAFLAPIEFMCWKKSALFDVILAVLAMP